MAGRRVLVSGASGLVGCALVPALEAGGYDVVRLVRQDGGKVARWQGGNVGVPGGAPNRATVPPSHVPTAVWDPASRRIDASALHGIHAVVNLSGETIGRRWSGGRRRRILESRLDATSTLAAAIAGQSNPPALINASAVGFYGSRGDEVLDESSTRGGGYLADVCAQWELATDEAARAGARVVTMRTGVVLAAGGGALSKMLLPFRFGLGGRVGDGRQWMSWIGLADLVRAIAFLIESSVRGPVNVTSPEPITNADFTRALGAVLRRPTVLPVPAFALRLALGEMAEETVLASQRAVPRKLLDAGLAFDAPAVEQALRMVLSP